MCHLEKDVYENFHESGAILLFPKYHRACCLLCCHDCNIGDLHPSWLVCCVEDDVCNVLWTERLNALVDVSSAIAIAMEPDFAEIGLDDAGLNCRHLDVMLDDIDADAVR